MQVQNGRWTLLTIVVLFAISFLAAGVIVLSLIPLYISTDTQELTLAETLSFTLNYNVSAAELNVPYPLAAFPANALKLLQDRFQTKIDADSQTAGTIVIVDRAEIQGAAAGGRKKRQNDLIIIIVYIRMKFTRQCKVFVCRDRVHKEVVGVTLAVLDVNLSDLATAILNGLGMTTDSVTSGVSGSASPQPITSTVAVTSGVSGSASPLPTTTIAGSGRRRRDVSLSPLSSFMPIAGGLVVSLTNTTDYIDNFRAKHAITKYFPSSVRMMHGVDGEEIDLYAALRQGKISKTSYNQLVMQDQAVHGHYLTLGSFGCLESHVMAWKKVIEVNKPMLILEDDVQFDGELFDIILPYILYSLPTNFSLLYFGNLVGEEMKPYLTNYNDLLWKVNGSNWGTYAYLIGPEAAATLLDSIYPAQAQIDSLIIGIAQSQQMNVFITKQTLVQTNNKSPRVSNTQRYSVSPIVIPRVFHFIWLGKKLPASARHYIQKWTALHPDWQIQIWTNDSIRSSGLKMHNRQLWDNSPRSARQASDILRYEIIYQYGGVYLDVDFEPLRSIEPLLHGVQAFVVHENEPFVCNGVFGAVPGHRLLHGLVTKLHSSVKMFEKGTVNQQTGPYHMTRQVNALKEEKKATIKDGFQIFAPHLFFPYVWYETDPGHPYDSSSFAVHHFRSIAEIERDAREGL